MSVSSGTKQGYYHPGSSELDKNKSILVGRGVGPPHYYSMLKVKSLKYS